MINEKTAAQLAIEIADECCAMDISVYCTDTCIDGQHWRDTRAASSHPTDEMVVSRLICYLTMRGQLERHPKHAHLIRHKPQPEHV